MYTCACSCMNTSRYVWKSEDKSECWSLPAIFFVTGSLVLELPGILLSLLSFHWRTGFVSNHVHPVLCGLYGSKIWSSHLHGKFFIHGTICPDTKNSFHRISVEHKDTNMSP